MAKMLSNIGKLTPDLFALSVSLGHQPGWRNYRKFGRNDDIDGNEEVWELGTARVLPSAAAVLAIVSSSTADDAVATGTGAWTIQVEGLDANYDEISEVITLDGTVSVGSSASFLRVNRAYIVTAGTGESNAGNITVSIGGDAQAYIEATEGQTHQTHYTVPNEHVLMVHGFSLVAGTIGGSNHIILESQIKLFGTNTAWRTISAIDLVDGQAYHSHPNQGATIIPAKTEIRQRAIFSGSNAELSSIFVGYLVHTDYI